MEKKLKMWIAVGVVVMVIVGGIVVLLYSWIPEDETMYEGEIKLGISQNETVYIINITELDVYDSNSNELHSHAIGPPNIDIKIIRENDTGVKYYHERFLKERTERTGIKWKDVDGDNNVGQGDKIILFKSGGDEYSPKKGDRIKIEGTTHIIHIESNIIEIP